MKKIKCGVVGTGRLGRLHCRMYAESPQAEFIGVYDIESSVAESIAEKYSVKAFPSLEGLLSEVDAVSIVVPTSAHYETADIALSSSVHCLVEKPFTGRVKSAEELVEKAEQKGLKLQVGHVERFNSAMVALKKLAPGAPRFVECHRLSPFPNRSMDVSVVMDLMIHDIDVCHWFIGGEVESCEAVGVEVLTNYPDIANARLKFANGSICDITASRITDKSMRKIRMFFQRAYASIDYREQSIVFYTLGGKSISKKEITPPKIEPLKEEIESFLSAIRRNEPVVMSGREAIRALGTAMRVIASLEAHNKAYNQAE